MSLPDLIINAINPLLILPIGIGMSYVGFGPLSRRKNPTSGAALRAVGLACRLTGAVLIVFGAFFWLFAFSMAFGGR